MEVRTRAWRGGIVGLAAVALLTGAPCARRADASQESGSVGPQAAPAGASPALEIELSEEIEVEDDIDLEFDEQPLAFPDPLEPINRRTLRVNQTVDRWVLSPVTRAYGYVMPDRAKQSVREFFRNLESPAIFVNDVLQGELKDAATTVARFSVNTVFGVAGLLDPASSIGLERHEADFGETLAKNGVGSGPYLIVPLLGPTTVRDGLGTLVDVALQPTIYLLGPTPLLIATVQEGTNGLALREAHGEDLERLEQGSLDYYAALRSAYYQDRMADLGRAPGALPDEVVVATAGEDPPT